MSQSRRKRNDPSEKNGTARPRRTGRWGRRTLPALSSILGKRWLYIRPDHYFPVASIFYASSNVYRQMLWTPLNLTLWHFRQSPRISYSNLIHNHCFYFSTFYLFIRCFFFNVRNCITLAVKSNVEWMARALEPPRPRCRDVILIFFFFTQPFSA